MASHTGEGLSIGKGSRGNHQYRRREHDGRDVGRQRGRSRFDPSSSHSLQQEVEHIRSGIDDNLKVQKDKSKFVSRPGYGSNGRSIQLISNHFLLKITDITCYHYDVDIQLIRGNFSHQVLGPSLGPSLGSSDDKKLKKLGQSVNRKVIEELEKEWRDLFEGISPVYDGTKNVYTRRPLHVLGTDREKWKSDVIEVDLENNKHSYKVQIKFARQIDFSAINAYYNGKLAQFPKEAIQALDIILRHGPTIKRVPIGNSLYSPWKPGLRTSIGDNREVGFGHYQSVRYTSSGPTLVIDRTATVFHTGGSVIDFVRNLIDMNPSQRRGPNQEGVHPGLEDMLKYNMTNNNFDNINKELKGLQIYSSHLKYKRKYKVFRVSDKAADYQMFDWDDGTGHVREITVAQYFRVQYNIVLKYSHLPCLNVGNARKASYLPLELCQLVPDQHVKKKITPLQTANMIRMSASQNSFQRFDVIQKSAQDIKDDSRDQLKEFEITLSTDPLPVSGRVLDPPSLQYNNDEVLKVREGKWDIRDKGLFRPIALKSWVLVAMAYQMFDNRTNNLKPMANKAINKFVNDLIFEAKKIGMSVERPETLLVRPYSPGKVELVIKEIKRNLPQVQLVMIISNENDQMYNEIKLIGDVKHPIPTQCIRQNNVWKYNSSLMMNLLLKVNVKIGGINSKISGLIFDKPGFLDSSTMIIAADVTHPGPADQLKDSIAAVVASYDTNYCYYSTSVRVQQKSNGEMINELDIMLKELLIEYQKANNHLPDKIIFYRDGVSEGQFDSVLVHEHKNMLEAFKSVNPGYNPKVTFVIVQKRHHTRFRVRDKSNGVGRALNIPPGTIVDRSVCHPTDFDFYLCSHEGLQGTSRPTHYVVLHDDNEFGADELQKVTFYLCHIYARCTRSISIPAPVMYAHLAAFRSRHHIIACNTEYNSNCKTLNESIGISGNYKTQLYYC